MKLFGCFLVMGAFCGLSPVHATTWTVEKDGSGDFTIIQDAVDSASDGDIIQIGPGWYSEFRTWSWGTANVFMDGQKSLTFQGTGTEATIIGPEAYYPGRDSYGFTSIFGPAQVIVENLKIVNHNHFGLHMGNDVSELRSCLIENCYLAASFRGTNNTIVDCVIQNGAPDASSIAIWSRTPHVLIQNVEITNYREGIHFDYSGSVDLLITDCRIDGGALGLVGASATFGAGGTIENCYFTNWRNYGIGLLGSGDITIRNNVIEKNEGNGVGLQGCDNLVMHDNLISEGSPCIYVGRENGTESIFNNHFFRAAGENFVTCLQVWPYGPDYVDLGNNYWGTTDTDELDQWIYDGNDNPSANMFVKYLPLADGPVSTESMTLDGVKALYR